MVIVHIDIETRSPIHLRDTGASRYFEDFEILIVCWAVGDGAVHQWLPCIDRTMPADLRALFDDPAVRFVAHNAAFEWGAFTAVGLQTPLEKWRCTHVLALALALPHHLAGLSEALKLGDEGKMKDGSRLHRRRFLTRRAFMVRNCLPWKTGMNRLAARSSRCWAKTLSPRPSR